MKRIRGAMLTGFLGVLGLTACGGKDGGGVSGPSGGGSASVCSEVSLSSAGEIGISGCSSIQARIGPIRYVGASSQIESYDFDITCNSNGRRYTGSVIVASRSVRVNGSTCRL